MIIRSAVTFVCVLGFLVSGCTALNTFPTAARPGETVALAVGSPVGLSRANTTATFTSDIDGIPVDITPDIRSIFKLYADKASNVYGFGSNSQYIVDGSGHEPWISIVALDLPLGLTVGPGEIQFTTTATYPSNGSHINDVPIPLEILPGTGSPSTFDYEFGFGEQQTGSLGDLEPFNQAVISPDFTSSSCPPCQNYAAIEIKVTMPTSLAGLQQQFIRVLVDDLTVRTFSGRTVQYGLNNGEELTVIVTSMAELLQYYEGRFTVVLPSGVSFVGTPSVTSVRYFDLNGNEYPDPGHNYTVVTL